jgi:CheY-like chemotaxis protein
VTKRPFAIVIEDEADLATIFSEALKAGGFDTETISDGAKALERLKVLEPQVIILDLHLPNVDGREILRHIRADERLVDVRVLVATADSHMAELVEPEADLVLLKPISFMQLQVLARRLSRSMA